MMVCATFLFASMGVCVKLASAWYGTGEIVMYRGLIGLLLMGALTRWQGVSLRTTVPGMHFWRSISGVTALCLWFYSISGLPLATGMTLNYMSSVWMALFLIGGTLVGLRLHGMLAEVMQLVLSKLLLMPLAVFGMLWLLPPIDPLLRTAAVLLAAMPMLSVYPVLAQKYDQEEFCAAALLAATVTSFFTISALIWGLGELDGWLP